MGVPKFYRWLSERYVSVNHVISDLSLLPEFDNLYLDMNGIIHACTHPNDQEVSQGLSQEEMMKNIWNYVDRIVTQIVKPQKLLYVAVDGVAPRAKMNQQRSRRFRAAKDAAEAREEAVKKGVVIDDATVFDSNCITPGTEFMGIVDAHLQYFIRKKMKEDPLWRRLTIIYSGHGIPGEGEHKIMQYIRDLKASTSYQPNVRHCMYGQDADLIMLALATHEPHFTLLREVIDFGRGRTGGGGAAVKTVLKQTKDASFQLLHLSILREYLEFEFLRDVPEEDREEHLERVVDDFVFLTFLVGNDFLPHLPSLDISEHAFDRLFELYASHFKRWGGQGYLTNRGNIETERLQAFFLDIGVMEDDIFEAREEDVADFNARRRRTAKRFGPRGAPVPSEEELEAKEAEAQLKYEEALAAAVKNGEVPKERALQFASAGGAGAGGEEGKAAGPRKNFRGRYYFEKLGVLDPEDSPKLKHLCKTYAEGLEWCLAYYVKGCVSWNWYYPYHYGPLISDVKDLAGALTGLTFDLGEPFKPFEQLLGCLPAASAKFLPRRYQFLMTSPTSPILDFYPEDFEVDMNGKHNPWEGVVLIPFIDEARLRKAIAEFCPETSLSTEEKRRNSFTKILTFRHSPALATTVPSCNPSIFPDITNCQTTVTPSSYSKSSLTTFEPKLVPGTVIPSPGFPSLKVLPIEDVKIEAIKVNVHGTESKYRTICLSLPVAQLPAIDTLAPEILGRPVYVNWPMMHEARITAVTDGELEYRLDPLVQPGKSEAVSGGVVPAVTRTLSAEEQDAWETVISVQQKSYLYGRGVVGLGGMDLGDVMMMLKVRPLQGLERCPTTGATKKVFGTHEAEVPIQMAMWSVPTADPRFLEQGPVPVQERLPLGAEVVFLEGKQRGEVGKVVGHVAAKGTVKVETVCRPPDRPIGLLARKACGQRYYDAGQIIRALNLDGRVLGKITGSCFVDPGKYDLGLNLKVKGKWVLPDYVRRKTVANLDSAAAWATTVDVVRIVGSADEPNAGDTEPGGVPWEYSDKAVLLIKAYMETFPKLFEELRRWPNEVAYDGSRLFGSNYAAELEKIRTWLAAQETANKPRVPLTTQVLSHDAIRVIERSADEILAQAKKSGARVEVKVLEVAPEAVHCALSHQPADVVRRHMGRPELGDRVVNLVGLGVPFGLRGTVVALHKHSACVEVLFDEEFIGGTSLQGTCSPYRGKLLPWSAVLKVTLEAGAASQGGQQPQGGKDIMSLLGASGGGGGRNSRQQQQQQKGNGRGGEVPVPGAVKIMPRQQPRDGKLVSPPPSSSSPTSNAAGQALLSSLKSGGGSGGSGGGGGVGATKSVDPRNARTIVPVRNTSKPVVPTISATGPGAKEGEAFGGHTKAQGPDGSVGFQRRRSREQAGTMAERVAEEDKAKEAQEMERVMGMLSVKEKEQEGNGTAAGEATNSLKGLLNLNNNNNGNPPPPPSHHQQQQQQPGYPYPGGPPQGGGFYPHPSPPMHGGPGYYFPPSMPGAFMPQMMMPYFGGPPPVQGSAPVPRRPRERKSSGDAAAAAAAASGADGATATSGADGATAPAASKPKPAFRIMPSQVLRSSSKAKAVAVAKGDSSTES